MSEPDAFGYRPVSTYSPTSVQVAEAKQADTLQPMVNVWFRFDPDEVLSLDDDGRVAFIMSPDFADDVAAQLTQWAARAREKHWK